MNFCVYADASTIGANIPKIISVVPASGPVGTAIKIIGSNFSSTNTVTVRNAQGAHAYLSDVKSLDGTTLEFVFPGEMDLPYPTVQGEGHVPPFHGLSDPGNYEVLVDNKSSQETSNVVIFDLIVEK